MRATADFDSLRELDTVNICAPAPLRKTKDPDMSVDASTLGASPETAAAEADCAVIVTDHSAFDYKGLEERARLIGDTRNALKGFDSPKIVRL